MLGMRDEVRDGGGWSVVVFTVLFFCGLVYFSVVCCSVVESRGVERSEVEWSGVEWSGVEWSGVEWSGVEWSGVEWSAASGALSDPIQLHNSQLIGIFLALQARKRERRRTGDANATTAAAPPVMKM